MRLVVRDLVRSFGGWRAFGPVSFEVDRGRVLGVAGGNGSGKTTLLKILAGLVRETSGSALLERPGAPAAAPRDAADAIGWCAPDLSLYGDLTAAENLDFFSRVAGRARSLSEVEDRLARVGLDPARVRATPLRALSTGQRQRVKLAFAVLKDPPLLLLDEPGSNLDAAGRDAVASVVAAHRTVGTVVLASNDAGDLALSDERVTL